MLVKRDFDRDAQIILIKRLQDETIGLGGLGLEERRFVRMCGHENNRNVQPLADLAGRFNPAHRSREPDVHQYDIRLLRFGPPYGLTARRRQSNHVMIQAPQRVVQEQRGHRIVFNDKNPVTLSRTVF